MIKAELPDVKKDQVKISVRSFTLPEEADGAKITAEYKDGVLHVHPPTCEKTKAKTIEVKIS